MKRLPDFLTVDDVLELHQVALEQFGGSDGLRDAGLLESAVAMPQAGFGDQFLHETIPAMAAAYLYHLIQNHPFVDGNKRVATMACLAFLRLNVFDYQINDDEWIELAFNIAQGRMTKEESIKLLESRCRPFDKPGLN
jgi:death-on-curing protein